MPTTGLVTTAVSFPSCFSGSDKISVGGIFVSQQTNQIVEYYIYLQHIRFKMAILSQNASFHAIILKCVHPSIVMM